MNHRVSSKLICGIVNAAESVGLDVDDMLSQANLSAKDFAQSDDRISHAQLCLLWQAIAEQTGDETIGLRLAACAQPETFDVVNYVLECSPNLGEALARLGRYIRLIHEASVVTLEVEGSMARLAHAVVGVSPPFPAVGYQWVMANVIRGIRRITGTAFLPYRIGFQQAQLADFADYYLFLQTTVQFLQPANELYFDASLLQQSLLRSNTGLVTVLDRYATELLAKLPPNDSVVNQVQRELQLLSQGGDPKLDTIAQTLQLSPRTLQRKLKEAGTSYQALLDQTRCGIAIYYLQQQQVTASDLAFLLGFSETSAFRRAFKRWTGKTLTEFCRTEKVIYH